MSNQTSKEQPFLVVIAAIFVWAASNATIMSNEPRIISPGSLVIVAPSIMLWKYLGMMSRFLAPLVGPLLFVIWCAPLFNTPSHIPSRTKLLAVILLLLAVLWLVFSWEYGIVKQGYGYCLSIVFIDCCFWGALFVVERRNLLKPTAMNGIGFHAMLFVWLSWIGFPWLGELLY